MRGSPSAFRAKERADSNQCKPFGLARRGGSFTTYLQTSYYLKLPDKQLYRAEVSSNDPRPELIITQASLRHQQSSTLIKVALPRRTREQPGSARQIGTLLQLHSSTHATTRICKVNWHTSGQTFSVSTLWMSISRLQSHKNQPAYNMDKAATCLQYPWWDGAPPLPYSFTEPRQKFACNIGIVQQHQPQRPLRCAYAS